MLVRYGAEIGCAAGLGNRLPMQVARRLEREKDACFRLELVILPANHEGPAVVQRPIQYPVAATAFICSRGAMSAQGAPAPYGLPIGRGAGNHVLSWALSAAPGALPPVADLHAGGPGWRSHG